LDRLDWRLVLKALVGFVAGLAVWALLSPLYDGVIATSAQAVIRTFEKPPVTHLRTGDDQYVTVDRSDFDPRSKRPAIPLRDLTFNFVLLAALFACSKRPFSDRNIVGFLIASLILAVTHVGAAITEVMSIYVAKLGLWSTVHYGSVARNFWGVANHFYRLVLMYAIAFALWWIFRGNDGEPRVKTKGRRRR
jgi:hypothetical protein